MQSIKQHRILVSICAVLGAVLIVSILFYTQNPAQPAPTTTPKPTPSPSPTTSPSPAPTNSPSPTHPTITSTPTPPTSFPTNPPASGATYEGEISQYLGVDLTSISTYVDYLNAHPDVAINGVPPINSATYLLKISGMVNNPQNLAYDEVVNDFTPTQQVATLPCVEGWSVTMLWQGIAITDLLNYTEASPEANTVIFLAADGYSSSLPLEYIRDHNIMIAYKMNNVTLTPKLGWPFFLVATNQYGYKWVEWITEINVSNDTNYLGYWESRGYPNNATVPGATGSSINIDGNTLALLATTSVTVPLVSAVAVFYVRHKKGRMNYSHNIAYLFRKNVFALGGLQRKS